MKFLTGPAGYIGIVKHNSFLFGGLTMWDITGATGGGGGAHIGCFDRQTNQKSKFLKKSC